MQKGDMIWKVAGSAVPKPSAVIPSETRTAARNPSGASNGTPCPAPATVTKRASGMVRTICSAMAVSAARSARRSAQGLPTPLVTGMASALLRYRKAFYAALERAHGDQVLPPDPRNRLHNQRPPSRSAAQKSPIRPSIAPRGGIIFRGRSRPKRAQTSTPV